PEIGLHLHQPEHQAPAVQVADQPAAEEVAGHLLGRTAVERERQGAEAAHRARDDTRSRVACRLLFPRTSRARKRIYFPRKPPMAADPISLPFTDLMPPLFAELPDPFADQLDPSAPWALLGEALDMVLDAVPSDDIRIRLSPDVHLAGDRVVICPGTRIGPGAVIEGPVYIGRDVEIRPGAYIRGGVWIGDGCVVGASTEIKRAILLPHAKAPHLNYVGDSILGSG